MIKKYWKTLLITSLVILLPVAAVGAYFSALYQLDFLGDELLAEVMAVLGGKGAFVDNNDGYPDLNWALGEISAKYNVTKSTIAAAWILRHPAKMQTIVGTMNYYRMLEIARAAEIELTREEWYRLYLSSGHILP